MKKQFPSTSKEMEVLGCNATFLNPLNFLVSQYFRRFFQSSAAGSKGSHESHNDRAKG